MAKRGSDEHRQNLRDRAKKLWQDPEFRTKTTESLRLSKQDPVLKQRLSEKIKERWSDPEKYAADRAAIAEGIRSDKTRAKMRESQQNRWKEGDSHEQMHEAVINSLTEKGLKVKEGIIGVGRWRYRYRVWRQAVLERDEHTCQVCGATEDLITHHLVDWKESIELRFDVDNGQTVCRSCHMKIHDPRGWRNRITQGA